MSLHDWAALPPELQSLVLCRLEVADYVRFGAVCRSWCWTVAQRICLPKSQIPWLMLSNSSDPDTRRFFSRADQKMYKIHLPEIHGHSCIGSSDGWLITVDELSELHALNPLTGASLAFPSVTTFSDLADAVRHSDGRITDYVLVAYDEEVPNEVEEMRLWYYSKAILHPSVVVVIHGEFNDLAFAHPGDDSWTELQVQPQRRAGFTDIIFRKGLLHALGHSGEIMVFDLDAPGSPMVTRVARPHSHKMWQGCDQNHLVESPDGKDLFQVWSLSRWLPVDGNRRRKSILPGDARMNTEFVVFKLDDDDDDWSEVEDLGDLALFLGLNRSMALSTREFPDLTSSCIYFPDAYRVAHTMDRRFIHDVVAFNLKDGSSHSHLTVSKWNWLPQIWITPDPFSSMLAASSKP
ncbi:F-box protein SKIP23-like [Cocos nucifera]|uniref:F-box protein SKIP23-like n=1 Tax=Cocos nucifera TaxID=13894 RepID=A0A8K0IJF6_COCNU|nr:F-box protein SKIP23-like [Cocos nucifera]